MLRDTYSARNQTKHFTWINVSHPALPAPYEIGPTLDLFLVSAQNSDIKILTLKIMVLRGGGLWEVIR